MLEPTACCPAHRHASNDFRMWPIASVRGGVNMSGVGGKAEKSGHGPIDAIDPGCVKTRGWI